MNLLQTLQDVFRLERVYIIPKARDVFAIPRIDLLDLYNLTSSQRDYDGVKVSKWAVEHMPFIFQICICYLCFVFGGQFLMRGREPLKLRKTLIIWNAILAIISIFGASYTVAELFEELRTKGLTSTYCKLHNYSKGPVGFATGLFVFSKIPELLDTVFLVLRKKPVVFLHWFHHVFTLFYAFWSLSYFAAFNRWGIALNFSVHAPMYSYYFLRSLKIPIPGTVAKIVTTSQILQFVIDLLVLMDTYRLVYIKRVKCDFDGDVFKLAVFMHGIYLTLFINFFMRSYIIGGGKEKYRDRTDPKKTA